MASEVRVDKWLWAVRVYKTRSVAADECKKGHVCLNGVSLKPSRTIRPGDVLQVRKAPITLSLKVLQPIENRVSAKLVPEMMENVTPPEQYELLEMARAGGFVDRAKGTGRPTKKERRDLDEFQSDSVDWTEFFDLSDE